MDVYFTSGLSYCCTCHTLRRGRVYFRHWVVFCSSLLPSCLPVPGGTTSVGVRRAQFQRRSGGQRAWRLAAPNEVIKTIRGSTDESAWPKATSVCPAAANTHTREREMFQPRRQKDRIDEKCVSEMTDSSPWAPVGSVQFVWRTETRSRACWRRVRTRRQRPPDSWSPRTRRAHPA